MEGVLYINALDALQLPPEPRLRKTSQIYDDIDRKKELEGGRAAPFMLTIVVQSIGMAQVKS